MDPALYPDGEVETGGGGCCSCSCKCCGPCMKYSLIVDNVIVFIGGGSLVVTGAYVWSMREAVSSFLPPEVVAKFDAAMAGLIFLGVVLMALAVLGCLGALMEVKWIIALYFGLMFIVFAGMVGGALVPLIYKEKIMNMVEKKMLSAIPYYGTKDIYTRAWDDTQTYLQCCGVHSYKDWKGKVPESCCKTTKHGKRLDCRSSKNASALSTVGCSDGAMETVQENAKSIGGGLGILYLSVLVGVILSFGLLFTI